MSRLARSLVQLAGRVTILVPLVLASAGAHAQGVPAIPAPAPPAGQAPLTPVAAPEPPAPPAPAAPPATNTAAPPSAWQDRLEEIDQRTRIIARKQELSDEAAAAKAKEAPSYQADEGGFAIIAADRQYQVRLKGLLQFDGRAFFGNDSIKGLDTFVVRRIRPILDGTLLGLVDFRFSPDFGNNTQVITDAYLDAHPRPWLRIKVGKFKQPWGLERLQADQDLPLIERALDQNLTPQRELGIQLWGDIAGGLVRYEAGVFNGNPDNGLNDVDSNEAKTYGGRIFFQPFNTDSLRSLGRLGFGLAGSTGNERGSSALTAGAASNTWLNGFKSAGQQTIFSYTSSTTDVTQTVVALGRHSRINPQLYYYKGPFGLLAEWVKEHQELGRGPVATPDTAAFNNTAGHVTVSVVIGGDATFEGVKPHKALDLAAGSLGALEIVARYNWLNVDSAAFTAPAAANTLTSVSEAKGFGLGLNWQLSRNIKASGNYEQTTFTGGGGTAATPTDKVTEKVAIGRFQVAF